MAGFSWHKAGQSGLVAELLQRLAALRGIAPVIAIVGLGLLAAAALPGSALKPLALALAGLGTLLMLLALGAVLGARRLRAVLGRNSAALAMLHAADPDRVILTDAAGQPLGANGQPGPGRDGLQHELSDWCADPHEVVGAMLDEVRRNRAARREFARPEAGLLVSAHRVSPMQAGSLADDLDAVMWRFTRLERPRHRDISMLGLPLLTLGPVGQRPLANPALMQLLAPAGSASPRSEPQDTALAALRPLIDQAVSEADITLPDGELARAMTFSARDGLQDVLLLPRGVFGTRPAAAVQNFDEIPVGVLRLDGQGRVVAANVAARQLMGLSVEDNRFLWEVVEGLGRPVADWLQDARAGRALNRPEVLRVIRPGAEVFVQITLRRQNPLAEPDTLLALVSDATELKNLEARFVQSQKMQAIGQLAGGVAHDFNNLLTAISGHCDLLLAGRDQFDPDHNDLLQIHQNANRAAALVRQLLAFSRKQTLQPVRLSLEGLLEDVVHLLTRLVGERITLTLRHDPTLPLIRADRRQLEQVIVNLVVNARDAMPMGGEIRIETGCKTFGEDHRIGRVTLPPGDYAEIQVIDTGFGIAADQIDKIFEPFYTTKRPGEGTGLGLSTAYGIVKQMGGFIFVDSVEGSGTVFSLLFGADGHALPEDGPDRRPVRQRRDDAKQGRGAEAAGAPPVVQRSGAAGSGVLPSPQKRNAQNLAGDAGPGPFRKDDPQAGWHRPVPQRQPMAPAKMPDGIPAMSPSPRPYRHANRVRPEAPPPLSAEAADPDGNGIVLLVEDEAPVRAFAARALRMRGYQVLEAEDGEQALEVLADPGLAVDIFVTDVIMPGRDGPAWVEEALQTRPGTPVVFMSGYIEDALTEALSRTPQALFLEKPFSLEGLCSAIGAQLSGGAS